MKGTRENDFTKRQDISTDPIQEKSNLPGSGACWVEAVGSRIRNEILGPVQKLHSIIYIYFYPFFLIGVVEPINTFLFLLSISKPDQDIAPCFILDLLCQAGAMSW